MADYDDYDDYYDDDRFDYGSLPPDQQQEFLFEQLGFIGAPRDETARDLFRDLMYNDNLSESQRLDVESEFIAYLYDEYGIDFYDVWDWEDFRAWYDSQ